MEDEEKEPYTITGEHKDGTEWRLQIIDDELSLGDAENEQWLEVELTIGRRWGEHLTLCFDGEEKMFEADATRAISDFSRFVDACIEMRERMIDAKIEYDKK